jgi:hypothetical protein
MHIDSGASDCFFKKTVGRRRDASENPAEQAAPACAVVRKLGEDRIFGGAQMNPGWTKTIRAKARNGRWLPRDTRDQVVGYLQRLPRAQRSEPAGRLHQNWRIPSKKGPGYVPPLKPHKHSHFDSDHGPQFAYRRARWFAIDTDFLMAGCHHPFANPKPAIFQWPVSQDGQWYPLESRELRRRSTAIKDQADNREHHGRRQNEVGPRQPQVALVRRQRFRCPFQRVLFHG